MAAENAPLAFVVNSGPVPDISRLPRLIRAPATGWPSAVVSRPEMLPATSAVSSATVS